MALRRFWMPSSLLFLINSLHCCGVKCSVLTTEEIGQQETLKRRVLKFDKANKSSFSNTLQTLRDKFSRLYSKPDIINNSEANASFLYNIPLSLTDEIIETQK